MPSSHDLSILRDLARRVVEISKHPDQDRRRKVWFDQNNLKLGKPPIYVSPEGAWVELLPQSVLQCEDPGLRGWEWGLRLRIYTWEHFKDDEVIDDVWHVGPVVHQTGWGLEPKTTVSSMDRGAFRWEGALKGPEDLAKLKTLTAVYDPEATKENLAFAQEVFGGILQVQQHGGFWWSLGLIGELAQLRGLQEVMEDMVVNPEFVHQAMGFITDSRLAWLDSLEQQGVLSLNNRNHYVGSGGFGFTEDLPAPGFVDSRVRLKDMWGFCEAQEISGVSPAMHDEFVLQYQLKVLDRFGLNCYGCCEPVHDRFHLLKKVPRLRRISVSPWCDLQKSAEAIQDDYVYSWKPNPSKVMMGSFDEARIRQEIRDTFEIARGCPVEAVLKDTHTCQNEPWRFDRWSEIAQEEAQRLASTR